ncbi:MAG: helix-turn-helix transcriptional regulator [Bdellovibrionales bacterium]
MSTKKSKAVKELEKIIGGSVAFGEFLYSLRSTEEMTQADLAEEAGTTKAKICDFEKGRRTPTLELAARLARALGHSEALFVKKILEEQIKEADLKLKIKIEAA